MKVNAFTVSCLLTLLPTTTVATTSALWGTNGELWDPATSYLRDFTSVGYKNGNEAIPDWPIGVYVTDYGAVPNDDGDDSQAFIDAIAACPDNHAIFVPKGKYVIRQQIRPVRDNFVLRGEDMYETVLYFPQNLEEIYPTVYHHFSYGYRGGFWHVEGTKAKPGNIHIQPNLVVATSLQDGLVILKIVVEALSNFLQVFLESSGSLIDEISSIILGRF